MSILGALAISTQGMKSQATALSTIGANVANVRSGGYKRSDPFFQTLQSKTTFEQSDINANRPILSQRISLQGLLKGTTNDLDLAISGDGFFITRTTFDSSGETLYTRDGSFAQFALNDITIQDGTSTITTKDSYLIDKNGNYLLGYPANADGTFPTTGAPEPMRVDPYSFIDNGRATTEVDLAFNFNSNTLALDTTDPATTDHMTAVASLNTTGTKPARMEITTISFVDSNGDRQTARMNFTKASANLWDVSLTYQGAPTAQVDTVTIGGTIETGDSYSVTVNGTTASYTATATDTLATVTSQLTNVLNASNAISQVATATSSGGVITLTADTAGEALTTTSAAVNGGATNDNTATSATLTANFNGLTEAPAGDPIRIDFAGSGTVSSYTTTIGGTSILPAIPPSFTMTYPAETAGDADGIASFTMDISGFTQYAANFHQQRYSDNGYEASPISRVGFNTTGHVVGYFSSGNSVSLYQVPLANFVNPDGLQSTNGMAFRETAESGEPDIQVSTSSGKATFLPNTLEISNVNLADEFTALIKTQRAYSSSVKAFQTVNEMMQLVKDMKR
ncbi:MAG: flagellar hook-basal body complex protein [Rhodospirillales bacterium]|nr:flagellar hook-basal body complex protein [Rhodospirillales bacterium]